MNEHKPVAARLRATLTRSLSPSDLEIIDESHKHASHAHVVSRAGTAGAPGETHFRIRIVTPQFDGKSRLERHRIINDLVADEMGPDRVHAIAIEARAPGEATP